MGYVCLKALKTILWENVSSQLQNPPCWTYDVSDGIPFATNIATSTTIGDWTKHERPPHLCCDMTREDNAVATTSPQIFTRQTDLWNLPRRTNKKHPPKKVGDAFSNHWFLHPPKPTCSPKKGLFSRGYIFQHVSFQGSKWLKAWGMFFRKPSYEILRNRPAFQDSVVTPKQD